MIPVNLIGRKVVSWWLRGRETIAEHVLQGRLRGAGQWV
jgi:hypothetical protein